MCLSSGHSHLLRLLMKGLADGLPLIGGRLTNGHHWLLQLWPISILQNVGIGAAAARLLFDGIVGGFVLNKLELANVVCLLLLLMSH